jgi:hypothetical protein
MNLGEIGAVFLSGRAEYVMPGRAELAEAEGSAGEVMQGFQTRIISPLRDEIADGVKAGLSWP